MRWLKDLKEHKNLRLNPPDKTHYLVRLHEFDRLIEIAERSEFSHGCNCCYWAVCPVCRIEETKDGISHKSTCPYSDERVKT